MPKEENGPTEPRARYRKLYRDPEEGVLAGVCTGIAQYFEIEPWIVRVITVFGGLAFTWVTVPAYIIAIFVLDVRPDDEFEESYSQRDNYRRSRMRRRFSSSGSDRNHDFYNEPSSISWRLNVVKRDIDKMESKAQRMEAYITSGRYDFYKEFENIDK